MPIHQQLRSLECSVAETVALLLRNVTKHCLAWKQSHCPNKVHEIQAVGKSSGLLVRVLVNFCFLWINEKDMFSISRNSDAQHQLF